MHTITWGRIKCTAHDCGCVVIVHVHMYSAFDQKVKSSLPLINQIRVLSSLYLDCYAHVPVYKSIMQQRWCSRMQEIKTFQAHWDLPSCIPSDPMPYLMNRNFKLKVIDNHLA